MKIEPVIAAPGLPAAPAEVEFDPTLAGVLPSEQATAFAAKVSSARKAKHGSSRT